MDNPFLNLVENSEKRFVELSTSHLCANTRSWMAKRTIQHDRLEPQERPRIGVRTIAGCWVATLIASENLKKIPEDLRSCITLAKEARMTHLLFEPNADHIHGLPVYTN